MEIYNWNIYRDMLLRRPLTLLTKLQIFKAGPSLRPIYFIIISEVNNNKALPSISCNYKLIKNKIKLS